MDSPQACWAVSEAGYQCIRKLAPPAFTTGRSSTGIRTSSRPCTLRSAATASGRRCPTCARPKTSGRPLGSRAQLLPGTQALDDSNRFTTIFHRPAASAAVAGPWHRRLRPSSPKAVLFPPPSSPSPRAASSAFVLRVQAGGSQRPQRVRLGNSGASGGHSSSHRTTGMGGAQAVG